MSLVSSVCLYVHTQIYVILFYSEEGSTTVAINRLIWITGLAHGDILQISNGKINLQASVNDVAYCLNNNKYQIIHFIKFIYQPILYILVQNLIHVYMRHKERSLQKKQSQKLFLTICWCQWSFHHFKTKNSYHIDMILLSFAIVLVHYCNQL